MSQSSEAVSIDTKVLARLQEQTGDEDGELMAELATVFIADARDACATLKTMAAAGPSDALSREAHRMKSGAANLGASVMTSICKELEERGASAPTAALVALVDRLTAELEPVESGLATYLAGLTPPRTLG